MTFLSLFKQILQLNIVLMSGIYVLILKRTEFWI